MISTISAADREAAMDALRRGSPLGCAIRPCTCFASDIPDKAFRGECRHGICGDALEFVARAIAAARWEVMVALKASDRALSEAREMLGVFEDHGGHDGLGGKGYRATIDHMDDARKANRAVITKS